MASTHKHIRSSTANKRPTTAIADGQIALNTNASSPGLFFKDSTGASIIKIGPVHVGSTAPNATPGAGGSSGNSTGEIWLDNSLTPVGVKIWNGSAWVNATPVGSTTVQGLLELATSAETQTGTDTDRAVTPAGLQSKVSDSTSTTSSTTIASSTAVKSAYDLANAALPKSGGTITGNLEIGTTGSLSFEGSTADAFETTIAVTNPTADRTITLPDQTGNFLVSGNASIVNADVNASAAIAGTKISPDFGSQTITTTGVVSAALGAAATPSITFTGDLNTGIYSPGADQVAISTNGANRFQIDSSGNITVDTNTFYVDAANNRVGVGTTSPRSLVSLADSNDPTITIENTDTTMSVGQLYGAVDWHGNDASVGAAGVRARVSAIEETGQGATSLVFSNTAASSATLNERLRIDSSGRVGIGTSAPNSLFEIAASSPTLTIRDTATSVTTASPKLRLAESGAGTSVDQYWDIAADNTGSDFSFQIKRQASTYFHIAGTTGRVGIGTTSPAQKLEIQDGSISVGSSVNANTTNVLLAGYGYVLSGTKYGNTSIRSTYSNSNNSASLEFYVASNSTNTDERMRLDTAGRLLVGTSTSVGSSPLVSLVGSAATNTAIYLGRYQAKTSIASGATLGFLEFGSSDGGVGAEIRALADANWGSTSFGSRLVFSTTADGASSPTERMRITSVGDCRFGTTSANPVTGNVTGVIVGADAGGSLVGYVGVSRMGGPPMGVNRGTNDGNLIEFYQDGAQEGNISVSGTTVSYNGAHLSRWSQLPSGQEREDILRGTVLSNIDEMCEWGEEDNEQLNRMKVSDVEGDKNVAGVFQAWDDDDDTYTDDFYCAMTGDFIIRIAEGVTVERGDLLMSAGDGTAKPQDDDIIRSKTIAKVTSTNVSCTYDDGSYCVPCVLMAC